MKIKANIHGNLNGVLLNDAQMFGNLRQNGDKNLMDVRVERLPIEMSNQKGLLLDNNSTVKLFYNLQVQIKPKWF